VLRKQLLRDAKGDPTSGFGRIQMIVDGKTLDMLFDTGATVDLTASALAVLGGTAAARDELHHADRIRRLARGSSRVARDRGDRSYEQGGSGADDRGPGADRRWLSGEDQVGRALSIWTCLTCPDLPLLARPPTGSVSTIPEPWQWSGCR